MSSVQNKMGFIERDTSESYTWNTRGTRTNRTNYLDRDRIEQWMTKMGMMIVGAWVGEQLPVVSGAGVIIGEDLFEGHSWTTGVVYSIRTCQRENVQVTRTRGCTTAKRHDSEKHAKRDHQPHERKGVESLLVFWRSAVAADGDVECTVLSRYTGTVIEAHCHYE